MKVIGIKKETKNKWERRTPLNPSAVKALIQKGYEVLIQPSKIRIYPDQEYQNMGAKVVEDISRSDLIIGIKEIPIQDIIPQKSHLFFSHTIKGQDYNMPMLQHILDQKATLIDYERIVDEKGRRLIFFGDFAGKAGMIEGLRGYGLRIKEQFNIDTPLKEIKHAYEYSSFNQALEDIKRIGELIKKNGLPGAIVPLNIFLLGYGHVSQGCQEVLSVLPITRLDPDDLKDQIPDSNTLYLSIFKEEHLVEQKDGKPFELSDYYQNGALYQSKLESYLSYCSLYVNAIYWAEGYPIFLDNNFLAVKQREERPKLQMICDITCDIKGSVQATVKSTKPDQPIFVFDAKSGRVVDGIRGEGFPVCAVDNLPCEFPKESSNDFSRILKPIVEQIMESNLNGNVNSSKLPNQVKKAVITHKGDLQPEYKYLKEYLKKED